MTRLLKKEQAPDSRVLHKEWMVVRLVWSPKVHLLMERGTFWQCEYYM